MFLRKSKMSEKENNYNSQKKYLSKQKQLRVWVNADKFEQFKKAVSKNNESIYGLINKFIDEYLQK